MISPVDLSNATCRLCVTSVGPEICGSVFSDRPNLGNRNIFTR
ncbi:unnamed protein product [Schistosoma mattheei]|uniref:Uncharacterized protein n=1 Tax=Schistosoma mattheei TaxID=31246 RepID=A0A3P8GMZ2_9TREM|nr:unnamed protein product [Schistosoma mattheei]